MAAERPSTLDGLRVGENLFDVGLGEPLGGEPETLFLFKFAMALATAPPRRAGPRARRGPRMFPLDWEDPERVIVDFPEPSTTSSDGDGLRDVTDTFEGVVRPVLGFIMLERLRGDGGMIFVAGKVDEVCGRDPACKSLSSTGGSTNLGIGGGVYSSSSGGGSLNVGLGGRSSSSGGGSLKDGRGDDSSFKLIAVLDGGGGDGDGDDDGDGTFT